MPTLSISFYFRCFSSTEDPIAATLFTVTPSNRPMPYHVYNKDTRSGMYASRRCTDTTRFALSFGEAQIPHATTQAACACGEALKSTSSATKRTLPHPLLTVTGTAFFLEERCFDAAYAEHAQNQPPHGRPADKRTRGAQEALSHITCHAFTARAGRLRWRCCLPLPLKQAGYRRDQRRMIFGDFRQRREAAYFVLPLVAQMRGVTRLSDRSPRARRRQRCHQPHR